MCAFPNGRNAFLKVPSDTRERKNSFSDLYLLLNSYGPVLVFYAKNSIFKILDLSGFVILRQYYSESRLSVATSIRGQIGHVKRRPR